MWFGNGTKSILFDIKKEEHKTIFGHPTTIKDYIKILYPDCPNNFDITKAIFANDESYLITSALYGKLVAWKLPNFERVELIPNSETIEKLEYGEFFSLGKNSL